MGDRTRQPFPRGTFCWADAGVRDLARTVDFYTGLFGWEARELDSVPGQYVTFLAQGRAVAGAGVAPVETDVWNLFLAVEDSEAEVSRCVAAGASLLVEPSTVPGSGRFTMLRDPSGAGLGLWEPAPFAGFEVIDAPGAPSWFELSTRDLPAAEAFYAEVFGWRFERAAVGVPYAQAFAGDRMVAGVMDANAFLPPEIPSHWGWYVTVEDAAASTTRAVELGGTVVREPDPTPFGLLGWVLDPGGASVKLHQPV